MIRRPDRVATRKVKRDMSCSPLAEWGGTRLLLSDSAPLFIGCHQCGSLIEWPCKQHPPPNYSTHCLITTMTWRFTQFLGRRCNMNWPLRRKRPNRRHSIHASRHQWNYLWLVHLINTGHATHFLYFARTILSLLQNWGVLEHASLSLLSIRLATSCPHHR